MARSDLLLSLVKSGVSGNQSLFRRTVEAIVAEERAKNHGVLADRLEEQQACIAELEQANNSDGASVYVEHRVNLPMVSHSWPNPCLVESEDFSDPGSGWPIEDIGSYAVGYVDGEYRILIRDDPWMNTVYVWGDYGVTDYRVEVDVRPEAHLDGGIGLVFWTELGAYVFSISDGPVSAEARMRSFRSPLISTD